MLDVEPVEPAPKIGRLSRLGERREARVKVAVGSGGDSGSAEPQAAVTGGSREGWMTGIPTLRSGTGELCTPYV